MEGEEFFRHLDTGEVIYISSDEEEIETEDLNVFHISSSDEEEDVNVIYKSSSDDQAMKVSL